MTKDDFNYYHSRTRINIECAFGILVKRWGILRRPLGFKLAYITALVEACMKLHNICRDERIKAEKPLPDQIQEGDVMAPRHQHAVAEPAPPGHKKHQKTRKRDRLWGDIKNRGLKRPKHSKSSKLSV